MSIIMFLFPFMDYFDPYTFGFPTRQSNKSISYSVHISLPDYIVQAHVKASENVGRNKI